MRNWVKSLDRVLKGEATRPAALRGGTIDLPLGGLTVVVLLLGVVYGACMGSFALITRWNTSARDAGYLQMAASAVKVPKLFFLTLVVTFPSLYVFNALVGSRLSFSAVLRLLVAALGVTLAVLASFGTIVVFFSLCTSSYPFMVLLNVLVFVVAGLLGMGFLMQTLRRFSVAQAIRAAEEEARESYAAAQASLDPAAAQGATSPASSTPAMPAMSGRLSATAIGSREKTVFWIWMLVFGLVGSQMGWVLRPFIGNPHVPFTFFREREGSFFEAVFGKLEDLAAGSTSRGSHYGGWRQGSNDEPRSKRAPNRPAPRLAEPAGTRPAVEPPDTAPADRGPGPLHPPRPMTSLLSHTDDLLRGRPAPGGVDAASGGRALARLLFTVALFGVFYGATMGLFGGLHGRRALQPVYSGAKVPVLLLVTFCLSLPSFFVLNSVLGVRADFGHVLHALVASQAVLTVVLASLAPLTAFWYVSSPDYDAALLFNAAVFAAASLAAQWTLRRAYRPLVARNPRHRLLLRVWLVIYAFVGIQMAWVLRPFVGDPHTPVGFFRREAWGNAYVELARTAARALGIG